MQQRVWSFAKIPKDWPQKLEMLVVCKLIWLINALVIAGNLLEKIIKIEVPEKDFSQV